MTSYMDWKPRAFFRLPKRSGWSAETECSSIVFLPTGKTHDSGYQMMWLCCFDVGKPICRIGGYSDHISFRIAAPGQVIHDVIYPNVQIDMLPNGLVQAYVFDKARFVVGDALSSIYVKVIQR